MNNLPKKLLSFLFPYRGDGRTHRRRLLDSLLYLHSDALAGKVVDIGGKKNHKRGYFHPKISGISKWIYLNIDPACQPDVFCDVKYIPLSNTSCDSILMTEVLEHLENPSASIQESYRILKPGGVFLGSIPFLYPVHADPYDFQRWTVFKCEKELQQVGYKEVSVLPMGGFYEVIMDLFTFIRKRQSNKGQRIFLTLVQNIFHHFLKPTISLIKTHPTMLNTGYFIIARK